jgi:hypothetical protein
MPYFLTMSLHVYTEFKDTEFIQDYEYSNNKHISLAGSVDNSSLYATPLMHRNKTQLHVLKCAEAVETLINVYPVAAYNFLNCLWRPSHDA